jgi:hypothetical protein
MCGRYTLYTHPRQLAKIFAISQASEIQNSFNIAPTENVSVICNLFNEASTRMAITMRWGLLPAWLNHPKQHSAPLINARIEIIDIDGVRVTYLESCDSLSSWTRGLSNIVLFFFLFNFYIASMIIE